MKYIILIIFNLITLFSFSQSNIKHKQISKKELNRKIRVKNQIKDSLELFLKDTIIVKSFFIKEFLEIVPLADIKGYKKYNVTTLNGNIVVLRYYTLDNKKLIICKTDLRN